MTALDCSTIPLRFAALCPNCDTVSDAATVCPACGNGHLLSLARILNRTPARTSPSTLRFKAVTA